MRLAKELTFVPNHSAIDSVLSKLCQANFPDSWIFVLVLQEASSISHARLIDAAGVSSHFQPAYEVFATSAVEGQMWSYPESVLHKHFSDRLATTSGKDRLSPRFTPQGTSGKTPKWKSPHGR